MNWGRPLQYLFVFFLFSYFVWFFKFHDQPLKQTCEIIPLPTSTPDGKIALSTEEILSALTIAIEKGHTLKAQKLSTALVQITQRNKMKANQVNKVNLEALAELTTKNKNKNKINNYEAEEKSIKTTKISKKNIEINKPAETKTSSTSGASKDPFEITPEMIANMEADVDDDTRIESGYHRREGWSISGNHVVSGEGCTKMDAQCSVNKNDAIKLCNSLKHCLGFTCNKGREDCQLRTHPLKHETNGNFIAWYKPGQIGK
jgi:hypothetical protein